MFGEKKSEESTQSWASALSNQKNPYNREKAETHEGCESGNRTVTAYLCTCSKVL